MNLLTDSYFDTLAACLDACKARLDTSKATLNTDSDLWSQVQDGVDYGQTRRFSLHLSTLKGKPTKKFFHVTVARFASGTYELNAYLF